MEIFARMVVALARNAPRQEMAFPLKPAARKRSLRGARIAEPLCLTGRARVRLRVTTD